MKTLLRSLVLALAAALSAAALTAADTKDETAAVNLTGKWNFAVETAQGSGTPTFTFEQKGEALTGTYSGYFGTAPLTGTVKGSQVTFTVKVQADGQDVVMAYRGEVAGDAIKGKIDFGSFGEATFTGKRAQ